MRHSTTARSGTRSLNTDPRRKLRRSNIEHEGPSTLLGPSLIFAGTYVERFHTIRLGYVAVPTSSRPGLDRQRRLGMVKRLDLGPARPSKGTIVASGGSRVWLGELDARV
jgi:hypothetical protein